MRLHESSSSSEGLGQEGELNSDADEFSTLRRHKKTQSIYFHLIYSDGVSDITRERESRIGKQCKQGRLPRVESIGKSSAFFSSLKVVCLCCCSTVDRAECYFLWKPSYAYLHCPNSLRSNHQTCTHWPSCLQAAMCMTPSLGEKN
jgi:hypothetical protein